MHSIREKNPNMKVQARSTAKPGTKGGFNLEELVDSDIRYLGVGQFERLSARD